jgi:hypothetical protein
MNERKMHIFHCKCFHSFPANASRHLYSCPLSPSFHFNVLINYLQFFISNFWLPKLFTCLMIFVTFANCRNVQQQKNAISVINHWPMLLLLLLFVNN